MNAVDIEHSIGIIDQYYDGLKSLPAGETDASKIYTPPSAVSDALRFFDGWNAAIKGEAFIILEKDEYYVEYKWNIPVVLENYPHITAFQREKYRLIG